MDENLRVCCIILRNLKSEPMNWTPLTKATLNDSTTPWRVQNCLYWLLTHGYIERLGRGTYAITDKGRGFLGSIDNPRARPKRPTRGFVRWDSTRP